MTTAALAAPILAVVWVAFFPEENIWPHLIRTALPGYFRNTLLLMTLVAVGTAIVGTGTAWLLANYRFPGRAILDWALLAPLAAPAYIAAYALVDFLEYAGPVQTALRQAAGWKDARDYWFPEIRSLGGAAFVMTFAFYPYVYMLVRAAFNRQSTTALEVARSLGCGPTSAFFRVMVPLARPAIVAGAALALMETLNDFGTVEYFAVPTLTTGIFRIWFETYNPGGAAQIALVMLVLVFGLITIERRSRRRARFHDSLTRFNHFQGRRLHGAAAWAASLACILPVTIGFALPAGVLAWRSFAHFELLLDTAFLLNAFRTAALAGCAATLAVATGFFLVYGARAARSNVPRQLARMASLGYAVPGAVLAIGVLIPMLAIDRALASLGLTSTLFLAGSVVGLLVAYLVRFAAIPYGAIDSGFSRITPTMEMAARTLGQTRTGAFRRVQLPLVRGSLLAAWLLVFVEAAKELPATLILRPFDFDTLATHVYTYASLEDLDRAAPSALAIIVIGLAPAVLLRNSLRRETWTKTSNWAKGPTE